MLVADHTLRGSEATEWGEGVPPPTVGSFCIFGFEIVQSGAYLERKFGLKINCIWVGVLYDLIDQKSL